MKIVSRNTSRPGSRTPFGLACCNLRPGLTALLLFQVKAQNPRGKTYLKYCSMISSSVHKSVENFHGLVVALRVALPWIDIVIPYWDWGQILWMDLPCGPDHASFP